MNCEDIIVRLHTLLLWVTGLSCLVYWTTSIALWFRCRQDDAELWLAPPDLDDYFLCLSWYAVILEVVFAAVGVCTYSVLLAEVHFWLFLRKWQVWFLKIDLHLLALRGALIVNGGFYWFFRLWVVFQGGF